MSKQTDQKAPLSIGTSVLISQPRSRGEIIEGPNNKGEFLVAVGAISIWLPAAQLREATKSKKKKAPIIKQKFTRTTSREEFRIILHGMTASQALEVLEETIDRALLASAGRLEVIHGKGTGTLLVAVHNYLNNSKYISSFKLDSTNPGTTWVYL